MSKGNTTYLYIEQGLPALQKHHVDRNHPLYKTKKMVLQLTEVFYEVSQAFVGRISENMLAACLHVNSDNFKIVAFFKQPINIDSDWEVVSEAAMEAKSMFGVSSNYKVNIKYLTNEPIKLPNQKYCLDFRQRRVFFTNPRVTNIKNSI